LQGKGYELRLVVLALPFESSFKEVLATVVALAIFGPDVSYNYPGLP